VISTVDQYSRRFAAHVALPTIALILGSAVASRVGSWETIAPAIRREFARHRATETWLSIGRGYAPCPAAAVAIDGVPWAHCSALSTDLQRTVRRTIRDEKGAHWSGLAFLLAANDQDALERSLDRLEAARRSAPWDPALVSDVAAALIERAGRRNQPVDLVAALELIEEARARGGGEPWLLFNRALALEKLELLAQARWAWGDFLRRGFDPSWSGEAQRRLAVVESRLERRAEPVDERLRAAALPCKPERLSVLAAAHPREAREFALDIALPSWGRALLARDEAEAAAWLATATAIGASLAQAGGDASTLDAVAAIDRARTQALPSLNELARAYARFGDGRRLYRDRDYPRATALLADARSVLARAGSPAGDWAARDLGSIAVYNSSNEEASAALSGLLATCSWQRYPALCGRASWALGLAHFRLGRLPDALHDFRLAASAFPAAREQDNEAAALGLEAETLRQLGDADAAWQLRYRGLRLLGQTRHGSIHNVLWEAGEAALEEGYPRVADLFAGEDVALFGRGPDRLLALEAYFRRALLARWRAPASIVLADLERASALSRGLPVSPLVERVEAEVLTVRAELAVADEPEARELAFEHALAYFDRHGLLLRKASALLARARYRRATGRLADSRADLEAAVKLFEDRLEPQTAGIDRRLYTETWNGVYDELIAAAAERPGSELEALQLLERSRGEDTAKPRSAAAARGPAPVVITYAVQAAFLYRFLVAGGEVRLARLPISRGQVDAKVRDFQDSLRFDRPAAAGTELARLLVPADLRAESDVCFVPDRQLAAVPFAALPLADGSGPLLMHHTIVIASSLQGCTAGLPRLANGTAGEQILLAGAPSLDANEFGKLSQIEGASEEITSLKDLYPDAEMLAGDRATAPLLLAALPAATMFHFAGHAVTHPSDPSRSFLALAPDPSWPRASLLTAGDLAGLRLPHLQLAVLSACDTFEPLPRRTEGISGLVRALLDAGASAVVGTLWAVGDRSSRDLLLEFHRRLRETGDPARALQIAQRHLLAHHNRAAHRPSTWAAFELIVNSG